MRKVLFNKCHGRQSLWAALPQAFISAGFLLLFGASFEPLFADEFEFFEKKIRPVLVERCYPCHSASAEKLKGELLLDNKEGMLKGGRSGKPAIVPGKAAASQLIEAIGYTNEELQMPPPNKGRLTAEQISDFITWVNLGAADPRTNAAATTAPLADKYRAAKA